MRYTYSRTLRSRARRWLYFVYRGSSNRSMPARLRNGASSSVLKTSDTFTHCGSAAIFLVATTNAILLIRAWSSSSLESVSSSTISSSSLSSLTSVTTASWSGCSRLNRMLDGPLAALDGHRLTADDRRERGQALLAVEEQPRGRIRAGRLRRPRTPAAVPARRSPTRGSPPRATRGTASPGDRGPSSSATRIAAASRAAAARHARSS